MFFHKTSDSDPKAKKSTPPPQKNTEKYIIFILPI